MSIGFFLNDILFLITLFRLNANCDLRRLVYKIVYNMNN